MGGIFQLIGLQQGMSGLRLASDSGEMDMGTLGEVVSASTLPVCGDGGLPPASDFYVGSGSLAAPSSFVLDTAFSVESENLFPKAVATLPDAGGNPLSVLLERHSARAGLAILQAQRYPDEVAMGNISTLATTDVILNRGRDGQVMGYVTLRQPRWQNEPLMFLRAHRRDFGQSTRDVKGLFTTSLSYVFHCLDYLVEGRDADHIVADGILTRVMDGLRRKYTGLDREIPLSGFSPAQFDLDQPISTIPAWEARYLRDRCIFDAPPDMRAKRAAALARQARIFESLPHREQTRYFTNRTAFPDLQDPEYDFLMSFFSGGD